MTEAEQTQVLSIVLNEINDIQTDKRGLCRWQDVANALTHIRAQVRSLPALASHNEVK